MVLGRQPILANFKPEKRSREKTPKQKRRGLPGNSAAHLAAIHTCPCCIPGCNGEPVQAHHLMASGERGGALRSPDRFAVPLCHYHHMIALPGTKCEIAWFLSFGIKVLQLAADLWASRQRPDRYRPITIEHRYRSEEVLANAARD